jgi:hypothetical protein
MAQEAAVLERPDEVLNLNMLWGSGEFGRDEIVQQMRDAVERKQKVLLSFAPERTRNSIIDESRRIVRAIISTDDIDRYGTIVDPKGMDAAGYLRSGAPVLWGHGWGSPVGTVPIGSALNVTAEPRRIVAEWQFASFEGQPVEKWGDIARAIEDIWYLYKNGHIGGYSIAFIPKHMDFSKNSNVPVYTEWELCEFSLVSVPANPHATAADEKAFRLFRRHVGPQAFSILLQQATLQAASQSAYRAALVAVKRELAEEKVRQAINSIRATTEIQSLHFKKEHFTRDEAVQWAKDHGFVADSVDETENEWRLRQFDPNLCDKDTFGTKEITTGVLAVFCQKKSQAAKSVGMENAVITFEKLDENNEAIHMEERAVRVNEKGVSHAKRLIFAGKVDRDSDWSFTADDGNELLGPNGDDWENYSNWFLAIDTSANEKTKERYKFPYGKNGKVYRRGVIAAKQRAAQHGYNSVAQVADELLQLIDKDEEKSARDRAVELLWKALDALLDPQDIDDEVEKYEDEMDKLWDEIVALREENERLRKIAKLAAQGKLVPKG